MMLRVALILASISAQTPPPASGPAEPSPPAEPAPPAEPSPPACADDTTWHKKGDEAKNCQWVSELLRYCSEACQRAHWLAGHKDECPCAHEE